MKKFSAGIIGTESSCKSTNNNEGDADAVAFGKAFIANPDLVARFAAKAPLNELNDQTFYGGGAKGYIDYPTLPHTA